MDSDLDQSQVEAIRHGSIKKRIQLNILLSKKRFVYDGDRGHAKN